ncbi:MAG: hypothetical protein M1269_00700 [Chloroflexi bacterium]|nr:hypothetical protein [Chloroflexota bacterium]
MAKKSPSKKVKRTEKGKPPKKEDQGVSIWFIVALAVGLMGFSIFYFFASGKGLSSENFRVIKPGMYQGEVRMYMKEPWKVVEPSDPGGIKEFEGDKAPKYPLKGQVYIYFRSGYFGYIYFDKEGKVEKVVASPSSRQVEGREYFRVVKAGMNQDAVIENMGGKPIGIVKPDNPGGIAEYQGDKAPAGPADGDVYIFKKLDYYGYVYFDKEGKAEKVIMVRE